MARRRIRRFGAWRPLGADITPTLAFAPPPEFLEAGDADELRVNAPPALVVVGVAPALVVVGAAFVVGVDDDVLARAFDGDEDDDEFGDDETSIDVVAGDAPVFIPRVFSFQVSLPLSVLLDENSVERRQLVNVSR